MTRENNIKSLLNNIQQQIKDYEQRYHHNFDAVRLIAVSKTQNVQAIQEALAAGQYEFGENYCQEALAKIALINHPQIKWHFIGNIQSNKTKSIAEHFSWVHTVDRLKIARLLNQHRPCDYSPLNICIQVNISNEITKSGVTINEIEPLCAAFNHFPNLKLRGLMIIPKKNEGTLADQRKPFRQLKQIFDKLNHQGFAMDTLSMGMSSDFEAAIAEGATMVRVGTAIFGRRRS